MSLLENPARFGIVSNAKNPVLNNPYARLNNQVLQQSSLIQNATGPQGFQGPMGERGPTGFLGMRGEVGPQGAQGPACSCENTQSTKEYICIENQETVSVEGETTLVEFSLEEGNHLVYCVATFYSNSQADVHIEFSIQDEENNKVATSFYNTSKKSSGYTTMSIPRVLNPLEKSNYRFVAKGKEGSPIKFSLVQVII